MGVFKGKNIITAIHKNMNITMPKVIQTIMPNMLEGGHIKHALQFADNIVDFIKSQLK